MDTGDMHTIDLRDHALVHDAVYRSSAHGLDCPCRALPRIDVIAGRLRLLGLHTVLAVDFASETDLVRLAKCGLRVVGSPSELSGPVDAVLVSSAVLGRGPGHLSGLLGPRGQLVVRAVSEPGSSQTARSVQEPVLSALDPCIVDHVDSFHRSCPDGGTWHDVFFVARPRAAVSAPVVG